MRRFVAACLALSLAGCGFDLKGLDSPLEDLSPYAAQRDVCGVTRGPGAAVPDCPLPTVCFTTACQFHDDCYAFCEDTRDRCDLRFYGDMTAICFQRFGGNGKSLQQCLGMALIYWGAVQAFGDEFYLCENFNGFGQPGACCSPGEPPTCENVDQGVLCQGGRLLVPSLSCDEVDATYGGCPQPGNDLCGNRFPVCQNQQPDPALGRCAPLPDDPITGDEVCSVVSQDCRNGRTCLPFNGTAYRCGVAADTRLALTDGPPTGNTCYLDGEPGSEPEAPEFEPFQSDVWYEYVAPCSGTMTLQMCNSSLYDAMLAVYGGVASNACVCPDEAELPLACNDDGCGGIGVGGIVHVPVEAGGCYVIRVGGYSPDGTVTEAARGVSRVSVGVLCGESIEVPASE